ncbi:Zn2/Cys6 DNA-binding protein [Purpureocillium lilacinum]|uniref:Zn2/Cys6 DNA-binding protein n=1 Tax=Purpureocillium lilacinum TaxID=33203 RepID=A0A179HNU2_PURLI|nr:Zn2/Cys6 DNA-binding protein [Purpureocillium lilacinum]OAQ92095.1 Zn2/Cys6 DNA-binding protein [Purpureocillium lilacinum]
MAYNPARFAADSGGLIPAPYGRACAGCARAKCKCFYQEGGQTCERCQRLGKQCEPAVAVRKRKAQTQPPPPVPSRLEGKLDDIVSLLRSQAAHKESHANTPSMTDGSPSAASVSATYAAVSPPTRDPDVAISTVSSIVHLSRPSEDVTPSPVAEDVAAHRLSPRVAEASLDDFRRSFLPMFPFAYIPDSMTAADVCRGKPFLWLVVMALSSKDVSRQFAMEETIWHIISQRIVAEHLADLDLLLGVICFASWSHYFKKDKPFMTMLSQLAAALAMELNIHKDVPQARTARRENLTPQVRTMEERRTMLAVFHLTCSTWTAYRKTEPLRWTRYLENCLRMLRDNAETSLDVTLATQVECQLIANKLTCAGLDEATERDAGATTAVLVNVLLSQLSGIRRNLPQGIQSERAVQFYLSHTEITIREALAARPRTESADSLMQFRRLEDLELLMGSAERWLDAFTHMPLADWVGVNVDVFAQFTHTLVVVLRLNTVSEPGWDLQESCRRADVLEILDRACDTIDRVPPAIGMVDAKGPRSGLFFKTTYLLKAIKSLFVAEMGPKDGVSILDDFLMNLENEPWLSDILGPSWDAQFEGAMDMPFGAA